MQYSREDIQQLLFQPKPLSHNKERLVTHVICTVHYVYHQSPVFEAYVLHLVLTIPTSSATLQYYCVCAAPPLLLLVTRVKPRVREQYSYWSSHIINHRCLWSNAGSCLVQNWSFSHFTYICDCSSYYLL